MKLPFIYQLLLVTTLLCSLAPGTSAQEKYPKREFRGVWIASVKNIDWPSGKGLPTPVQQREFLWILDEHSKNNINAVIVQVRPATDAFYYSSKEPWSEWLAGEQGLMPAPYYDPLEFMIKEAHKRGMEFHAWFNPYRAMIDAETGSVHPSHITRTQPTWFVKYDKHKLFNPGLPAVRDYIVDIISDVVRRYDVDAIHFDDYFYPYPVTGQEFKDDSTFVAYGQGFTSKDDWRRNNINLLIESISTSIKSIKPHVKFGISPFGVWRNKNMDPKGSPTAAGQTCYDNLYADVLLWLNKGWIDYVAPQIYFSMAFEKVPYGTTTEWWTKNAFGRHLYIGHGAYKIGNNSDKRWDDPSEIPNQLRFNRNSSNLQGSVFFSSKSLTRNLGNLQDSLRQKLYKYPALVPAMPWKDKVPPLPPQQAEALAARNGVVLTWEAPAKATDGDLASYYVIYRFVEGEKINIEDPTRIVAVHRDRGEFFTDKSLTASGTYYYVITAADKLHNESAPSLPAKITYRIKGNWAEFVKVLFNIYLEKKPK